MANLKSLTPDFVVVGSGLSGLCSAIVLSAYGRVLILTKKHLSDGSTELAQGGIAAVLSESDSFSSHIDDTMVAGVQGNDRHAVEMMVREAPDTISWLSTLGIPFDRETGIFSLGKEGGHSERRIVHATDFTGREIESALIRYVRTCSRITIHEHAFVSDLIREDGRCIGVWVYMNGCIVPCYSRMTVLATGGLGQVYKETTNPSVSTGDGIAMAVRAGVVCEDLAYIQFHPTALDTQETPKFLLSEAIRGEGAYLKNHLGQRFMIGRHAREELAPRDIVAREICNEQQTGKVYLDISHKDPSSIRKRFPNIYGELKKRGYDLTTDRVPVTPAVHYSCGGIRVDTDGKTSMPGLFAVGEVSRTGVHGANRLASNSLLEAAVFPRHLHISAQSSMKSKHHIPEHLVFKAYDVEDSVDMKHKIDTIRSHVQHIMWSHVGILRTIDGLTEADKQIRTYVQELKDISSSVFAQETRNMVDTAQAIISDARARPHSIGAHYLVK